MAKDTKAAAPGKMKFPKQLRAEAPASRAMPG
jgi:hypothetical protein